MFGWCPVLGAPLWNQSEAGRNVPSIWEGRAKGSKVEGRGGKAGNKPDSDEYRSDVMRDSVSPNFSQIENVLDDYSLPRGEEKEEEQVQHAADGPRPLIASGGWTKKKPPTKILLRLFGQLSTDLEASSRSGRHCIHSCSTGYGPRLECSRSGVWELETGKRVPSRPDCASSSPAIWRPVPNHAGLTTTSQGETAILDEPRP